MGIPIHGKDGLYIETGHCMGTYLPHCVLWYCVQPQTSHPIPKDRRRSLQSHNYTRQRDLKPHTITIHYPHCLSAKSIAWNQYKLTIHNKNKITTKVTEVSWKLPWQQGSCGKHGAHLGPTGPRWAPCWPHEPCYLSRAIMRFPS